jgi:pre-mRNA-splicing helicase BRR2
MAEGIARFTQYEYRANSNLVLTTEGGPRRDNSEGTGELEPLNAKNLSRMGDRVQFSRPNKKDAKKRKTAKIEADDHSGTKRRGSSVVSVEIDESTYRPKTKETKVAYEKMLSVMAHYLGDHSEALRGGADEVLAILKNDRQKDNEKKKEIETLLGRMTNEDFNKLMICSKDITDFSEEGTTGGEAIDDEMGVSVTFVDSDEESDESDDEIRSGSDDEEEEGEDTFVDAALRSGETEAEPMQVTTETKPTQSLELDAKQVDAYWLQRELSKFYTDPIVAQKTAADVLSTLQEPTSRGACENRLVTQLGYDRFDFIKVLIKNRKKIIFCTRLARSEGSSRAAIEKEIGQDPEGAAILEELKASKSTQSKATPSKAAAKQAPKVPTPKVASRPTTGGKSGEAFAEGKQVIDLEALAFGQGSHLMSNKQCSLPEGSVLVKKKGYEEVRIPAPKKPAFTSDEKEILKTDLPEWTQAAFDIKDFVKLNRIQSKVFDPVFYGTDNALICAPTGAGKTNIALLAMLHEIGLHRDPETGEIDRDAFKIIYIAPMKALVQEIVGSFTKRLQHYKIVVKELTGDQNLTKQQISETQIIVTTPEKWDIVTRKSGDRTFTQFVKLIIIDEIHLLHDERGPVLESIVARTIRGVESSREMVRMVGLSATLPNYEDVATFLRVKEENLFVFENSYRPVPLQQTYIGITEKKALKRLNLMNEITYEKVMENAGQYQVLVFVHSRKETVKTAKAIRDMALENDTLSQFLREESSRVILQREAEEGTKSADLQDLLPYGFATHHAGMSRSDRTLVEDLFHDGHIQVLVSTATLAWGVNLPAHTVIIKGTQIYNPEKGRWVELSHLDVMQMLGRAGRPAYDVEGFGVLITTNTELQFYLSLQNNQLPIESQFFSRLADQLNAEIVLGTIQNARDAVNWLAYTYLYICMLRNPALYGISWDQVEHDEALEKRRADLIHTAATILDKHNMIKYDRRTGNFQVTDLGRVASYYYVTHTSMATFFEHLKPTMSDIELFRLFSLSTEFKNLIVRDEEKADLEKLLERVPIPVKEGIEEPSAKVNVLLQAYISQLKFEGLALISDMVYVQQSAARILRALFEIVLKRGWAQLAEKTLTLSKMVERRMWSCQTPLRQFKDIPEPILKRIERKDYPMDRLYDLNAGELGELIHFPSQGKNIFRKVHQFPRLDLSAHVQPITRAMLRVELTITPDFLWDEKYHGKAQGFWIWVEDVDGENILHHEYFVLKQKFSTISQTVSFTVPIYEPLPPQYYVRIASDRWIGSETYLPVSFRHLILPEKNPRGTELLDLQPLPLKALEEPKFEALYSSKFQVFNPIQTQTFSALFKSDENVLIAAPTGSGKTLCAEIAMIGIFNKKAGAKRVVYVAPTQAIVTERLEDWTEKFQVLGKKVAELTGETISDLKILEKADIVLSTPERWDVISRRWKTRKPVTNISLFIVDELHLIGGPSGPTLEVVVSRMHLISSQMKNSIRLLGLSSSLANGKDIGEWLGASSGNIFNFRPDTRPVPLEIHLQGFDSPHFEAAILAMSKPTINALHAHAKESSKPVIIFAPSKKHAIKIANDLLLASANTSDSNNEKGSKRHLRCTDDVINRSLDDVSNKIVANFLKYGIGLYHEGMTEADRIVVAELHKVGLIQVAVVTNTMCWSLTLTAHLVVIMGSQSFDGKEHKYVDYQITDILQMMGRANLSAASSSSSHSDAAVCVLLCHAPKKEFYKKFIYDPLPVESHLDLFLQNHINAEVVTKTIESKQDAVDYITWTFLYKRLPQNPNYYNLQGVSNAHLSDHLSELVENTLNDLEQAKCITVENEIDLSPLNLGMIAAYYYLDYTTVELFSNSLNSRIKLRGLIEILASATEYEEVPVRHREPAVLRRLAAHLPNSLEKPNYLEAHTKVNILLQSHFSRTPLSADMKSDMTLILENAIRLIQAMVDVISSSGWLLPALVAMELSQMVTQAIWSSDSPLRQLPHFSSEMIERGKKMGVESIFDLQELDDKTRGAFLKGLSKKEQADVAKYCNRYPSIDLRFEVAAGSSKATGGSGKEEEEEEEEIPTIEVESEGSVVVNIQLERERGEGEGGLLPPVFAPHYPKEKQENWWLIVGEMKTKQLLAIKRVVLQKNQKIKLDFTAPATSSSHQYKLYFMCDSYAGCDQEYDFTLNVV